MDSSNKMQCATPHSLQ